MKFHKYSKKTIVYFIIFFVLYGLVIAILTFFEINAEWLRRISVVLLIFSELLLAVSWLTPGILILTRFPSLAYAWLEGMNLFSLSYTLVPWKELTSLQKTSTYFLGITLFAIAFVAIMYSIFN